MLDVAEVVEVWAVLLWATTSYDGRDRGEGSQDEFADDCTEEQGGTSIRMRLAEILVQRGRPTLHHRSKSRVSRVLLWSMGVEALEVVGMVRSLLDWPRASVILAKAIHCPVSISGTESSLL